MDAASPLVLTFACRLMPTQAQHRALAAILEQQRELYNAALEERILAWAKGVSITVHDQSRSLTQIRADDPAFRSVQRRIQAATLDNLDRAYKAFFRRARQGDGAASGFPQFKSRERFDGFRFNAPLQIKWDGKRLRFAGVPGGLRVSKRDRERLPKLFADSRGQGTWKGVWFKRHGRGWRVGFQAVTEPVASRAGLGRKSIGVDWGTSVLACLSSGEEIPNPRPGEALANEIKRAQRAVARKKRGSKRRLKARRHLQAVQRRVANRRKTHLDKVSKRLVTHWATTAIEDIAVRSMTRSGSRDGVPETVQRRRNREALDAAPYMLRQMVAYKARKFRNQVYIVPAENTTQECSGCGALVPKELTTVMHECAGCGLKLPRKVNAARVILDRAGRGPGGADTSANGRNASRRPGNTSVPDGVLGTRPRKGAPSKRKHGDEARAGPAGDGKGGRWL